MGRIVYVNNEYVPENEAKISIFDRGFLFADAVYEVTAVLGGKLVDFSGHMSRLYRSLQELSMKMFLNEEKLLAIHRELIKKNNLYDGAIYIQVSRGSADRDFLFPTDNPLTQSCILFTQKKDFRSVKPGISIVSEPDIRWSRRDIKTVQLLASSLAKVKAKQAGKDDAWLVAENGQVTEGTSSNVYIVTQDGTIVTRNLSNSILAGITRGSILRLAAENNLKIEERPFTIAEAQQAKEAFSTSATTFVQPVIEIDGVAISGGQPGPQTRRLTEIYIEESERTAL